MYLKGLDIRNNHQKTISNKSVNVI